MRVSGVALNVSTCPMGRALAGGWRGPVTSDPRSGRCYSAWRIALELQDFSAALIPNIWSTWQE